MNAKSEVINVKTYLENRLSENPCWVVVEIDSSSKKPAALLEEAVSLICRNYTPYGKV